MDNTNYHIPTEEEELEKLYAEYGKFKYDGPDDYQIELSLRNKIFDLEKKIQESEGRNG